MPAFEWVHVQLHQQKGMISLSPPTICNSAFSSALATARSRGGETRHGALSDQIPLELGQGGEDSEHHATGRSRGVDLSALSSQNPQADLAV
ncbi:transposase IS26 [Acinetobacter baumannii]|nr:transposase IS26 [Acinetobacter baumannii]SSQ41942.1 transposase IS26 [Acinetobacter baumannii]